MSQKSVDREALTCRLGVSAKSGPDLVVLDCGNARSRAWTTSCLGTWKKIKKCRRILRFLGVKMGSGNRHGGMAFDENRSSSPFGAVLLFTMIGLLLSVESQAAEKKDLSSRITQTLGVGSVIEIMDDLDFGLSREKRFCEGQDAGFFRSLMSNDCCTVRINPLDAPLTQQIVLGRGLRSIKDVSEAQTFAVIDGKYEVILNCGDQAPTAELLKKSLGTRVQIHEMRALSKKADASTKADESQITDLESSPKISIEESLKNITSSADKDLVKDKPATSVETI
jgi:hypothetical protein